MRNAWICLLLPLFLLLWGPPREEMMPGWEEQTGFGENCEISRGTVPATVLLGGENISRNEQEDGRERPYWILPVAVFFFVSVTTVVVCMWNFRRKSSKKPRENAHPEPREPKE